MVGDKTMPKYRKKPIIIEAVQWTGDNFSEIKRFCVGAEQKKYYAQGAIQLPTIEGIMLAFPSAWIIKGIQGEFYPCKDDIFQETYERVE